MFVAGSVCASVFEWARASFLGELENGMPILSRVAKYESVDAHCVRILAAMGKKERDETASALVDHARWAAENLAQKLPPLRDPEPQPKILMRFFERVRSTRDPFYDSPIVSAKEARNIVVKGVEAFFGENARRVPGCSKAWKRNVDGYLVETWLRPYDRINGLSYWHFVKDPHGERLIDCASVMALWGIGDGGWALDSAAEAEDMASVLHDFLKLFLEGRPWAFQGAQRASGKPSS
jgi:hypothetical protein